MNRTFCQCLLCKYPSKSLKNANEKATTFPFHYLRLPFNWKTPSGYTLALVGFYAAGYASMFGNSSTVLFMIGSCWLTITFIKDIQNDLSALNVTKRRRINGQKLRKRFCNIVRQFCEIEQLSDREFSLQLTNQPIVFMRYRFISGVNHIYEFMIFGYFIWTLLSISSVLFVLLAQFVKYSFYQYVEDLVRFVSICLFEYL